MQLEAEVDEVDRASEASSASGIQASRAKFPQVTGEFGERLVVGGQQAFRSWHRHPPSSSAVVQIVVVQRLTIGAEQLECRKPELAVTASGSAQQARSLRMPALCHRGSTRKLGTIVQIEVGMRKIIAAVSALTALAAPVVLAGSASAAPQSSTTSASTAAASCTYYTVENDWYCNNRPGIEVTYAYHVVGYLDTGRNAFVCRFDGGDWHGGLHPNRWIYTEADHTGKYGFVSDNDVYDNTDVLRSC